MPVKAISYIELELDWLESTIKEWIELVNSHKPFTDIPDRTVVEPNAKGVPTIKVIAKKEETIKVIKDILKDLPGMLNSLKELRKERAEADIEIRGNSSMNQMFKKELEKDKT